MTEEEKVEFLLWKKEREKQKEGTPLNALPTQNLKKKEVKKHTTEIFTMKRKRRKILGGQLYCFAC